MNRHTTTTVLTAAVALVAGIGVGVGAERGHRETVSVTPSSCRAALHAADSGFEYAAQAMEAAQSGMIAVSRLDEAGVRQSTGRLTAVSGQIGVLAPKYRAARGACLHAR